MDTLFDYTAITPGQFSFLYNVLSFAFAAFFAGAIGLFIAASQVGGRWRLTITIAGLVALVASYHYFRIFRSWDDAYVWVEGGLLKTVEPFNITYRYADWLLTVPLLMVELVDILDLRGGKGRRLMAALAAAAALMIGLGYPGEVTTNESTALLFWVLSMLPVLGIFLFLVLRFGRYVRQQPPEARGYVNGARWLTASVWWVYPILYLFPLFGWTGGTSIVVTNTLFAVADLTAKVGLGVLIAAAALAKSRVPAERGLAVEPAAPQPAE